MSDGNIVGVCVCYLCISHSGLPVEASVGSHGRGIWVCYRHLRLCNPRLESYWEQVYKGPHPHQHNIPPPDRTNYTANNPSLPPPPPTQKQARITSQPDCSVCIHSQRNGTSVVRDAQGEVRA